MWLLRQQLLLRWRYQAVMRHCQGKDRRHSRRIGSCITILPAIHSRLGKLEAKAALHRAMELVISGRSTRGARRS
jgi:hypothetical protein